MKWVEMDKKKIIKSWMLQLAPKNLKILRKNSKMEHYTGSDMTNKIFSKQIKKTFTQIELLTVCLFVDPNYRNNPNHPNYPNWFNHLGLFQTISET